MCSVQYELISSDYQINKQDGQSKWKIKGKRNVDNFHAFQM